MYKTILTHVRPTRQSEASLRLAVGFASRFRDAHLIGLGGCDPYIPSGEYVTGDMLQMIADQQEADCAAAAEVFSKAAGPLGAHAHWKAVRKDPAPALVSESASADLIIASLDRRSRDGAVNVSTLVMEAGLPVIAAPEALETLEVRKLLVAWRNTAEAHRAVSAALPLLREADEVVLVEVVPKADRIQDAWSGLNAAVGRLSRQGIIADGQVRVCGRDVGSSILEEAAARGSDVVILGAYGHSRAREWVLGGVTRDLLERTPVPLFLVH
jgi:nucleotide-binding universal stress UspA family protein